MSKLKLSMAIGNYDRARPLFDGAVQIDGVDPVFMQLPPEEIFFRAFRTMDFDICELSMSSFTVKTALGDCPYVGVPAFVSRAFRHNSIYVRTDRIKTPADLKGKRIGLPEYQLTACVWARAILEDDHGVKPSDVIWVRGGIDDPSRPEKITIKLPPGVRLENAPEGKTISQLLEAGDIDAFIAPRVPRLAGKNNPNIGWLFRDPIAAGKDYYKRTGIFPIMHVTGIRRTLVEQHPWLPGRGAQGVRAGQDEMPGGAGGHRDQQVHAAVCRRAAQGRARIDGTRLLVLWPRAQPQGAGDFPAPPSFGRAVAAPGHAGGDVPSLDARELHDLRPSLLCRQIGAILPDCGCLLSSGVTPRLDGGAHEDCIDSHVGRAARRPGLRATNTQQGATIRRQAKANRRAEEKSP